MAVGQEQRGRVAGALNVAKTTIEKAKADVVETQFAYQADLTLQKQGQGAVSTLDVEKDKAKNSVALASLQQANAGVDQASKALQSGIDAVASAQAQVETAKFNLSQCTVRSPSDGFVTDWQIRVGTMVNPISAAAAGTFIDTSDTFIIASYPAEELIHVQPGQEVEMAFKSKPGYLFQGEVENILEATGQGQFTPGGKLPSAEDVGSPGFFAVKIRLNDKEQAAGLALGTPGTVAIYTGWAKPFALIGKVVIRMHKWLSSCPRRRKRSRELNRETQKTQKPRNTRKGEEMRIVYEVLLPGLDFFFRVFCVFRGWPE